MLDKIRALFKSNQASAAQLYLEQHHIQYAAETGYMVDGIHLNRELGARLKYLSNRRLQQFDDLKALYDAALLINEKIDLEIAHQRFNSEVANTEENLLQFKLILKTLNDYYRNFLRDQN